MKKTFVELPDTEALKRIAGWEKHLEDPDLVCEILTRIMSIPQSTVDTFERNKRYRPKPKAYAAKGAS